MTVGWHALARKLYEGGMRICRIAEHFGVTDAAANFAVRGRPSRNKPPAAAPAPPQVAATPRPHERLGIRIGRRLTLREDGDVLRLDRLYKIGARDNHISLPACFEERGR